MRAEGCSPFAGEGRKRTRTARVHAMRPTPQISNQKDGAGCVGLKRKQNQFIKRPLLKEVVAEAVSSCGANSHSQLALPTRIAAHHVVAKLEHGNLVVVVVVPGTATVHAPARGPVKKTPREMAMPDCCLSYARHAISIAIVVNVVNGFAIHLSKFAPFLPIDHCVS